MVMPAGPPPIMQTSARRDGSSWILNGEKTWITNGSQSDVAVVWARAEEGIVGFLVERGTHGFSTSDIHGKCWTRSAYAARRFSTSASIFALDSGGKYLATYNWPVASPRPLSSASIARCVMRSAAPRS